MNDNVLIYDLNKRLFTNETNTLPLASQDELQLRTPLGALPSGNKLILRRSQPTDSQRALLRLLAEERVRVRPFFSVALGLAYSMP